MKIIAVDISGRHKMPDGRYMLVCAAVYATISPFTVQRIEDMKIVKQEPDDISVEVIAGIIQKTAARFEGILVTEGEFYNYPEWRVEAIMGRKFKYAESVGERKALEIAHHVSLAAHRLLQEQHD
ncbi:MAG TPA: DUF2209 family protein [Methanocellaceae archaeon]